jgi:hypothetical protein
MHYFCHDPEWWHLYRRSFEHLNEKKCVVWGSAGYGDKREAGKYHQEPSGKVQIRRTSGANRKRPRRLLQSEIIRPCHSYANYLVGS